MKEALGLAAVFEIPITHTACCAPAYAILIIPVCVVQISSCRYVPDGVFAFRVLYQGEIDWHFVVAFLFPRLGAEGPTACG